MPAETKRYNSGVPWHDGMPMPALWWSPHGDTRTFPRGPFAALPSRAFTRPAPAAIAVR
jgi:hypothetical protein